MSSRKFSNTQLNPTSFSKHLRCDSFQLPQVDRKLTQDQFHQNSPLISISSPILKMQREVSPKPLHQNIFNFSSNSDFQDFSKPSYKSSTNSPSKENKPDRSHQFFASKKYSIPDGRLVRQLLQKEKDKNVQNSLQKMGSNELAKQLRKLNGKRAPIKQDNEEEHSYKKLINNELSQEFYSEKFINYACQHDKPQKFSSSALNPQHQYNNSRQLQDEVQKIRHENTELKKQKQELMKENLQIKRQTSDKIHSYSFEIESLREQIYRMQMETQNQFSTTLRSFMDDQRINSTRNGTILGGRSGNLLQHSQNNMNIFYVEELQKQNQQLIKENRRLNEIIMKRLKHSIAD